MDFESFLLVDVHECSQLFVDCSFICVYIWCFLIYVYYLWLIVVAFCWFVWMFKDFLNVCGFYVMHVQCECSYASSLFIDSFSGFLQWIVILYWMFTAFHKVWIVMAWFQVPWTFHPISVWWFHESNGAIETDQTSDCWTIGIRIGDIKDDTWSYII